VFFFHNKRSNNIFSHDFFVKRTDSFSLGFSTFYNNHELQCVNLETAPKGINGHNLYFIWSFSVFSPLSNLSNIVSGSLENHPAAQGEEWAEEKGGRWGRPYISIVVKNGTICFRLWLHCIGGIVFLTNEHDDKINRWSVVVQNVNLGCPVDVTASFIDFMICCHWKLVPNAFSAVPALFHLLL